MVLCIDVEPDPRVFDRADPPSWEGFERTKERLQDLRGRLARATGVPAAFTWTMRMDPQVAESWGSPAWIAERYADEFAELAAAGDEFGVHTHVWRWDTEASEWVDDFQDSGWTEHCLSTGLDAFEAAFGGRCAVHRGGDYFLTGEMLSILAARGVKVDLTPEPGLRQPRLPESETARGSTTDWSRAPIRPYRATPSTFPGPDPSSDSDPLLVPLSSAPRIRPPFRRLPLYLWDPPKGFGRRLTAELVLDRPAILAFAVRSGDASMYPELWEKTEANLQQLAQYRQMAFMTASAAAESSLTRAGPS